MWEAVAEDPGAVVFVGDRAGAALRRRERCLKLAGIPYTVAAERRASGTYYKLCVREQDAVAAHLALQMGGVGRSVRLQEQRQKGLATTIREMVQTFWEEIALLAGRAIDLLKRVNPLLLIGSR
jgi:hypothetical protein